MLTEPVNFLTREAYSGKNAVALAQVAAEYPTAEFLTFKQALSIGRAVRKGEHGTRILKVVQNTDEDGNRRRGLRSYHVFNIAQTDPVAVPEAVGGAA